MKSSLIEYKDTRELFKYYINKDIPGLIGYSTTKNVFVKEIMVWNHSSPDIRTFSTCLGDVMRLYIFTINDEEIAKQYTNMVNSLIRYYKAIEQHAITRISGKSTPPPVLCKPPPSPRFRFFGKISY